MHYTPRIQPRIGQCAQCAVGLLEVGFAWLSRAVGSGQQLSKTLDEVCQHRGVGKLLSTVHDQFTSTSCILAATGVCNSLLLLINC